MVNKRNVFSIKGISFPKKYKSYLNVLETEAAIKFVKDAFQTNLSKNLKLNRVSAPVVVPSKTGINDQLNGVEKPVSFRVKDAREDVEVVQSLAKWKRQALADYKFKYGGGLYTDMNAIRPDEKLDCFHSIYVDQWDWEKIIKRSERNLEYLKKTVRKIYGALYETEQVVHRKYKKLPKPFLPKKIHFVHSEELETRYPTLTPQGREEAICREKKAVFIIGIGAALKNGKPHDGRAADYVGLGKNYQEVRS
ncbi:aspartate--ammonia ligase, partial [bacterium]|nr:aspartate--ammonia ligase [bacterium]